MPPDGSAVLSPRWENANRRRHHEPVRPASYRRDGPQRKDKSPAACRGEIETGSGRQASTWRSPARQGGEIDGSRIDQVDPVAGGELDQPESVAVRIRSPMVSTSRPRTSAASRSGRTATRSAFVAIHRHRHQRRTRFGWRTRPDRVSETFVAIAMVDVPGKRVRRRPPVQPVPPGAFRPIAGPFSSGFCPIDPLFQTHQWAVLGHRTVGFWAQAHAGPGANPPFSDQR